MGRRASTYAARPRWQGAAFRAGARSALSPFLRTSAPRARLRNLEFRGVVTAAMVYDHLPIIDVFRRVDEVTMLGAMDWRGEPAPYFFILTKES